MSDQHPKDGKDVLKKIVAARLDGWLVRNNADQAWFYSPCEPEICWEKCRLSDAIRSIADAFEAVEAERDLMHKRCAVLSWMVKYDLLDAGNEYRAEDVISVMNDFAPSYAAPPQHDAEARARALEEAAKVADDEDGAITHWGEDRNTRTSQKTAAAIATAIRALNVKPEKRGAE